MNKKKNESYNLDKSRPAFFWIGMVISMAFVITAFEWKSKYDTRILKNPKAVDIIDELVFITKQDEPKPPKPKKIIAPNIVETDEEVKIDDIDLVIDLDNIDDEMLEDLLGDMKDEDFGDSTFAPVFLESQPMPKGGLEAFYTYVGKNIKYPRKAQSLNIEGKVFVQFVIDKTGKLTELEVLRGIGGGCDEEALRVLAMAPDWTPGKQRARPVKVRMVLPITFKMN